MRNHTDLADWYYQRADRPDKVFSTRRTAFVPLTDAAYLAWFKATGFGDNPDRPPTWHAVPWPRDDAGAQTAASLQAGLPEGVFASLEGYANARQWALAVGGRTITVDGTPIRFETDPLSMTLLNGKVTRLGQPNPPSTVGWQLGPDQWVDIPAADFAAAATAVADYVQATFDALRHQVLPGIASGGLASRAAVDEAFAIALAA